MKKFFWMSIVCLLVSNNVFSQGPNWITPNKTYLKMYVAEDGMYRINSIDFTNAGINTAGINPRTVKLYNKGIQIPIYFNGEQDNVFHTNDYFDFYGTRNTGGLVKTYDQNNVLFYTANEYYNEYSDTNVYWVDWGGSNGIRYQLYSYSTGNIFPNSYFNDLLHFEREYFYYQGENISLSDFRFLNTEKFKGEGWYWSKLFDNQTLSETFSTPQLYLPPQNATIKIFAYPPVRNTSITNEHSLQVSVNGTLITTLYSNDMDRIETTVSFSSSLLVNSGVNTVSIKYVPAAGSSGAMNIDYFEVQYPRKYEFTGSQLYAGPAEADTTSKLFRMSNYTSVNPINIYDVKNNFRIINFTNNLDSLKFTGKSNAKFAVINDNIANKPFRIKQKVVPDLVSSFNGADYLLIYNSLFENSAERLRDYRQEHDNFRSFKAEIEDIYDIFNYGLESPVAVRLFVKHVYETWELPKLKYLCLLGRGSLDPKKNLSTSVYYKNLIPIYGYPPSDGYFSNINLGSFFYYDQIALGRLPAYYPEEAQAMVEKIMDYENQSFDSWNKNFSYITGGGTLAEQSTHQARSDYDVNSYILPPSLSGNAHKIYRNDSSGGVTFNLKDSVRNDINRGTFLVNYRGHAGSHDWEVAMTDPVTLSNQNRLPVILSLTCFTGESSLGNLRGFGEKFLYLPNKGSIGFIGTTGWSYLHQGNELGTHIVFTLKQDSTRKLGALTKYVGEKMGIDSLSFAVRHTINCYKLIGDPATTLSLSVRPEFAINNSDYKLTNNFPMLNEPVTATVFPKNFGLFSDSCKIRFQLKKDNQSYSIKDTVIRNFESYDTLSYSFRLDSIGLYSLIVTLDQNNWQPLENKNNNSITINIPVKNLSFVLLKPVDNSLINSESVEFVGLNPRLSTSANNIKVILQFDTTNLFNSSQLRTFVNDQISGVTTKFNTSLPFLVNNTVYYSRTNSIINNDSSGWSKVQTFTYNNSVLSQGDKLKNGAGSGISNITIHKVNGNQYSPSDLDNTTFKSSGIELVDHNANLFVRSLGNNAEEASYFSVGDKNIYIDAGNYAGLNMLKVSKSSGSILELKNLKMISTASSDSLVNFLNSFNSNHYLMLLNAAYVAGGTYLTESAKIKLRQFGSIYCDSIGLLSYFHTWSLIGYLGADYSQVSEMYDPCCRPAPYCVACDHWTQSVSSMNVVFRKTSGTATSIAGPAESWSSFAWSQTFPQYSNIYFDVYGINSSNQEVLLLFNVNSYQYTDISYIDAHQYPKLKFVAKLDIDVANGGQSASLESVTIDYNAPPELILNNTSLTIDSRFQIGDNLKFKFDYYNTGYSDLTGVIVNAYKKTITASNLIYTDTVSSTVMPESFKSYTGKFIIPTFRDSAKIYFEVKPSGSNEFYSFNNLADYSFAGPGRFTPSAIQVYNDNLLLNNGDYVRKKPEFKINVTGTNAVPLQADTTRLSLKLNDIYVPYFINGNANTLIVPLDKDNAANDNNLSLFYYPELENGTNKLTVTYKDENDNIDTVSYDVFVSGELVIKDFYNYPNPMKAETNFIFNLAGLTTPKTFKIKIYTVSGRLIKEINPQVNIGYNQIPWDGRDNDGDNISNGTYLYKLVTEDETKIETQTEKLVILK